MKHLRNRHGSIYGRLLGLLVAAAAGAFFFFLVLNWSGDWMINYFTTNTNYVEQQDNKRIESLQTFITDNDLSSSDSDSLTEWVKKQAVVAIQIYKNGHMVYDSNYPGEDFGEEAGQYSWEQFYTVSFVDGETQVLLYGFYDFQIYTYALIAELILSFFLFVGIVMLGIRKIIQYILTLSREIKILEGGDLSYPITVSGHDELSRLAQGLDSMRQSFQAQTEQEKRLALANQRMITEMSHDLRTPLTSIMLYTEILLKGKYGDKAQMLGYIAKIDQKARRLKQLSDHLFEYALISGETEIQLEKPALFQAVFFDMLSEATAFLEQQGFQITLDFPWKERYIRVNRDYTARILDNLTSNIVKYADITEPVHIQSIYSAQSAGFSVKNRKTTADKRTESTKIGLQNIQNMMKQMGGRAIVIQSETDFTLQLQFPAVSRQNGANNSEPIS